MKRKIQSLLVALFLALSMCSTVYATEQGDIEQKGNSIVQLVITYTDEEGVEHPVQGGTGFLVGDKESGVEYVITAKEVTFVSKETEAQILEMFVDADDRKDAKVEYSIKAVVRRDVMVDAQLVAESDEMGFAILKLSQQLYDRETIILCDAAMTGVSGQKATVLGFPTAPSLTGETTYYAMDEMISKSGMLIGDGKEENVKYVYHNITPNMGMIGGPIVDEEGNVIALNLSKEAQEGYYALQMSELLPVLEALGVPYVTTGEVEAQREAELAAMVHKEELQSVITSAEAIDSGLYYKDTYAAVETSLLAAKDANDNELATQEEVDAAVANLNAALGGLKEKPPLWFILLIIFLVVAVLAVVFLIIWKKTKPKRELKKQKKMEDFTVSEAAPVFGNTSTQKEDYRKLVMQQNTPVVEPQRSEEIYGETTVFCQDMEVGLQLGANSKKTQAYLIRKRTGEKIIITEDEFVLGKDPSQTDYCIAGNSAISRAHATIICRGKEYDIADKNATNGTYVNGVKVAAFQKMVIKDGDVLRLADEEFEFKCASDN